MDVPDLLNPKVITQKNCGKYIQVEGITLDNIINNFREFIVPPILIKIDIQGFESKIIESIRDLDKKIKVIIIEVHKNLGVSEIAIINKLNNLGFTLDERIEYLWYKNQIHLYFKRYIM